MGFQHPEQFGHMMKGVKAAVKSPRTPAHLKPHLQKRMTMPSTMRPGDGQLMRAAARTPKFDDPAMNQQAVQPMEESLSQEAMAGNLKRDVSKRGPMQLDNPRMNPMMKRAIAKNARKPKPTVSALFGDFGDRPKGI